MLKEKRIPFSEFNCTFMQKCLKLFLTLQLDRNEVGISASGEPSTPERVFKIVFVGDSGVGKSSFIHRFCHDGWKPSFTATIGNSNVY